MYVYLNTFFSCYRQASEKKKTIKSIEATLFITHNSQAKRSITDTEAGTTQHNRRKAQLQRQLYLSMRKTANYTEAQGIRKKEDGTPSANFVVAAQSREASVWLLAHPSLLLQQSGHSSASEDTFTHQAKKCTGRKRFLDDLPRQSTKETFLKAAAEAAAAAAVACGICRRQIAMP